MPATAMPAEARAPGSPASGVPDQTPDVVGQRLELDRGRGVGGDVPLGVADDAGLQRGVEGDRGAVADDHLGRAAADVDHQRRDCRRLLDGGAAVGEARLLLAVEDAGGEGETLAQLGDEGAAVGGVAHGAGRDRLDLLDACLAADRDVVADRLARGLDRLVGELPREVDAAAQPRHPAAAARARRRHRRHRRSAAASSCCRRRSPRPVENSQPCGPGTLERPQPQPLPAAAHAQPAMRPSRPPQTDPATIASMDKPPRGGAAR